MWPVDRLVFKDYEFYAADNLRQHDGSETCSDVQSKELNETNEETFAEGANKDGEIVCPELRSPDNSVATTTATSK